MGDQVASVIAFIDRSMHLLQGVERADVLDLPADRHDIAHAERRVQFSNRLFDEEVVLAGYLQTHANVVAQVDELGHAAGKTVCTILLS